jgi:hypothetical protein
MGYSAMQILQKAIHERGNFSTPGVNQAFMEIELHTLLFNNFFRIRKKQVSCDSISQQLPFFGQLQMIIF